MAFITLLRPSAEGDISETVLCDVTLHILVCFAAVAERLMSGSYVCTYSIDLPYDRTV